MPAGRKLLSTTGGRVETDDFRVDIQLAYATRDDLGILRTEIENKDLAGHGDESIFPKRRIWEGITFRQLFAKEQEFVRRFATAATAYRASRTTSRRPW